MKVQNNTLSFFFSHKIERDFFILLKKDILTFILVFG